MNDKILIENFIKLYHEKTEPNKTITGQQTRFTIKSGENNIVWEKTIKDLFNDSEILKQNVTINLSKCIINDCYFFFNIKDFLLGYEKYKDNYLSSNIIILDYKNSILKKGINEEFSHEKAIIFNFPIYQKIFTYLKNNPLFTTLYGEIKTELIIVSKDNGTFHIGCKSLEENVSTLDNIKPLFEDLIMNFEKKEFVQFFKENIILFGIGNFDTRERFFEIIRNLSPLLLLTERDYENYVRDFNFEKIKTKFKEERNKYFEGLEKNIELVSKQVLSIPLTFAATAFASYQVKESPYIVFLILIGFSLYTFIAYKMLEISKFNIKCINEDVTKEEDEIKNNYEKNYEHFKVDFEKIHSKISKLNNLICFIKTTLVSMLTLFVIFSIIQYSKTKEQLNSSTSKEPIKHGVIDTVKRKKDNLKKSTLTPSNSKNGNSKITIGDTLSYKE